MQKISSERLMNEQYVSLECMDVTFQNVSSLSLSIEQHSGMQMTKSSLPRERHKHHMLHYALTGVCI